MMVYLSHPVLDYVTGNKPLWLGGPSMGLGVIQRPVASDGAPPLGADRGVPTVATIASFGGGSDAREIAPSPPHALQQRAKP
jgi:hypothetical protein